MSSRPACRASPVGADEKSSLNWRFSRLSPSRFMSYLPLLPFGPSATVPGADARAWNEFFDKVSGALRVDDLDAEFNRLWGDDKVAVALIQN
jgi:hypothetical protein